MKRAMIVLLTAATLMAATPTMAAIKFSDVKDTDWSTPSIEFMVNKKVLSGYEDGTFKPGNPVSKAELAHMYHALFPNKGNASNTAPSFADTDNHWAAKDFAVLFGEDVWAFADHYDKDDKPYLVPDKQLTRWDFVMLIGLLTKELEVTSDSSGNVTVGPKEVLDTLATYKDIKIRPATDKEMYQSSFYSPVILTSTIGEEVTYNGDIENMKAIFLYSAIKKGIMVGADGKFRPSDKVTRAEAITILHRVYKELGYK
jgi:hypothetical protein